MFTCRIDDHVDLVLLEEQHATDLFKATDEDRAHLATWMSWIDESKTAEDTLNYIRRALKDHAEKGDVATGVRYDGKFIGGAGFHSTDRKNRKSEIGYWLAKGFEGRGIMTRCVVKLLQYGFDEMKLNRIEIRCATGNSRSRAIPERLGFHNDGTLRQVAAFREEFHDHVIYSMLAGEFVLSRCETRAAKVSVP